MTRRRGRKCKKLLDDLKDKRGYCQFKEEALDRTMWRNRFGRGFGLALCGGIVLEEALDLSFDILRMMMRKEFCYAAAQIKRSVSTKITGRYWPKNRIARNVFHQCFVGCFIKRSIADIYHATKR